MTEIKRGVQPGIKTIDQASPSVIADNAPQIHRLCELAGTVEKHLNAAAQTSFQKAAGELNLAVREQSRSSYQRFLLNQNRVLKNA